jgi:predicted nucleic acid-binding protein
VSTLVDSSVWIDFLNGLPSREAVALREMLREEIPIVTCGLVVAEVCQGLRRGVASTESDFRALRWLEPRVDTYFRSAEMFRTLRAKGFTIRSTIDCLVVALAEEAECWLLARDRDMAVFLESGLASVKPWPV